MIEITGQGLVDYIYVTVAYIRYGTLNFTYTPTYTYSLCVLLGKVPTLGGQIYSIEKKVTI